MNVRAYKLILQIDALETNNNRVILKACSGLNKKQMSVEMHFFQKLKVNNKIKKRFKTILRQQYLTHTSDSAVEVGGKYI